MFTCIQWNARSISNKWHWLRHKYFRDAQVLAIQETFLKSNSSFYLKDFRIFRQDRLTRPGGGVLIAVHKSIPVVQLTIPPDPSGITECVGIQLTSGLSQLNIINLYKPQGALNLCWLNNIIKSLPHPFLILGDLNIDLQKPSHPSYQTLMNWLDENNLFLINTSEVTRRGYIDQSSILDISICTPDIWFNTDYCVHPDSYDSDHYPISLFCSHLQTHIKGPRIKNITKWTRVSEEINHTCANSNLGYEQFVNACNKAIKNHSFKFTEKVFPKFPPFWDWECSKLLAEKRKLARLAKKHISSSLWSDHRRIAGKLRRIINEKSKKFWDRTCLQASKDKSIFKLINNLKNRNKPPIDIIFQQPHKIVTDREDQANDFLNHFTPHPTQPCIPYDISGDSTALNNDFTLEELNSAINNMKNSAPGADGITAAMFKHLDTNARNNLKNIFNLIFTTGEIPSHWNTAIILPIKKPNMSKNEYASYRPITLMPVGAKLFERILLRRIINHLITNGILHPNHYGFMPHRGCLDLLCEFYQEVTTGRNNKKFILAASLDIKSAFDSVWIDGLIYKYLEIGLRGKIGLWLANFLSNRHVQVRWQGILSRSKPLNAGVPQGGVLSAILFTIFLHDIFEAQHHGTALKIYADDIFVYVIGDRIEVVHQKLQNVINDIVKWCNHWHLNLSVDKCKVINFSRSKKIPQQIFVHNQNLNWSDEIRILGIWFNRQFNFSTHVKDLKSKAQTQINLLRSISANSWGITSEQAFRIINATVRSLVEYGSPIFSNMTMSEKHTIDVLYNNALRVASGLPGTTPIPILRHSTNQGDVHARLKFLGNKFLVDRISHHQISPLGQYLLNQIGNNAGNGQGILSSLQGVLDGENLSLNCILTSPWVDPILTPGNYTIILRDLPFQNKSLPANSTSQEWNAYYHQYISDSVLLATDASKDDVKTSIAAFNATTSERCARLVDSHNSVFTAESMAIELAIHQFINDAAHYVIISDSFSSLTALDSLDRHSPVITKQLHNALCKYTNQYVKVTLLWVPGHAEIGPNCTVDRVAKEGPFVTNDYRKVDPQDIVRLLKYNLQIENEFIWKDSNYSEDYDYLHIIDYNTIYKFDIGREWEVKLHRWRTQQVPTNYYLFKIQRRDNPFCDSCIVNETVHHILLDCPIYSTNRRSLLNILNLSHPSYSDIMIEIHRNIRNAKAMIAFLTGIDRNF